MFPSQSPVLSSRAAITRLPDLLLLAQDIRERGNIDTPLELAIANRIDRFSLVIDVIDRVPGLAVAGSHVKERMKGHIIANRAHACAEGTDKPEFADWRWPERNGTP